MIKKHLVPASIMVALLASNGVMAYQYNKDVDSLSSQLNVEKENVVELKNNNYKLNSLVDKQNSKITELENDNKKLNKTIDNKDKKIKQQNENINSLEKKLKNKDVSHQSP